MQEYDRFVALSILTPQAAAAQRRAVFLAAPRFAVIETARGRILRASLKKQTYTKYVLSDLSRWVEADYYLCRATSFGEKHLMPDEIRDFHLSTLRLTYDEAVREYERLSCTPIGRLIAARELPILQRAAELLKKENP